MAIQDTKLTNKMHLGISADSAPKKKIPATGSDGASGSSSQGHEGQLRQKISLGTPSQPASAPADNAPAPAATVPEYDYRAEADYRNEARHAGTEVINSIDERISQYDDEYMITDDMQYQDGFVYDATATASSSMGTYETNLEYKNASEGRKKLYRRASIVFLGIFIVSGTLLALMLGTNWLKNKAYVDLSSDMSVPMTDKTTATTVQNTPPVEATRNWAALREENPHIKYWMNVEHKPIDYPLVQHPSDQMYYLKHDFWGNDSTAGTPFIDYRNYLTDKHILTYGHHITGSETMYSTVNKAWKPDEFAEIGKLTLEAPTDTDGTSYEIFYPAFAFMVDQSYQTIQEFEFADDAAFRQWLLGMANEASAKNEWTDYLVRNARRALTFVTCASDTPNQRERTIIVFIAVTAPSTSYDNANFLPQDIAEVTAQQQLQQQATSMVAADASVANQAPGQPSTLGQPHIATKLSPIKWLAGNLEVPNATLPDSPLLTGKPWR